MAMSTIQRDLCSGMKAATFTSNNIQNSNRSATGFDLVIDKYTNTGQIISVFTRFGYFFIRIMTNNTGTPTPSILSKINEDSIQVTAETVGNNNVIHITNGQNWNTFNGFVTNATKAYVSNMIYNN